MPTEIEDTNSKRRKKVVIGITKATWGGAQRYCFDLATHLAKNQFDVVLVAGESGLLAERLKAIGIRVIIISGMRRDIRWLGELLILKRLISILRSERPDILHLNSPKMAGLGALAGRILGVPKIVVTIHGWSFFEDRNTVARTIIWFFSWFTAVFTHKVIVITHRDYLAAQDFPFIAKRKFTLIPNGIGEYGNFVERTIARKELRDLASFYDTPFIIGTITELTANKDLPTLIRAAAKLPQNAVSIIIGGGEDETRLRKLIEELDAAHKVFLTGFVKDAWRLLRGLDCFILTSVKEGLPYVIMEAMAAGLPIIATNIGGIPDLLVQNESGILVAPKDPEMLAAAIRKLAEDGQLRDNLAKNARYRVEKLFNINAMIEETRRLYREVSN
ncbi:MAG: glycosyltransferase family 4 protein [Candidatus Sungbacteria bacterium]|nr:glycosyltransferase family 4 protein [Candidatus Sungbacteria bacterium]